MQNKTESAKIKILETNRRIGYKKFAEDFCNSVYETVTCVTQQDLLDRANEAKERIQEIRKILFPSV